MEKGWCWATGDVIADECKDIADKGETESDTKCADATMMLVHHDGNATEKLSRAQAS